MKIHDLFEKSEYYLYRGIPRKYNSDLPDEIDFNLGRDRRPRDTSRFVHDLVNALCVEKFGIPVRNLAFFYLQYGPASNYGTVYIAKPNSEMTYYYVEGVKDFTQYYDSDKYSHLDGWSFASNVIETKTFSEVDESLENKRVMFDILNTVSISLNSYKIKNIDDIEQSFEDIAQSIYVRFDERGYKISREETINMVKEGLYNYFNKFFNYVEKMKSTSDITSVPDDVEIMVNTRNGKINLTKFKK